MTDPTELKPTYSWQQIYEMHDGLHWALCDSESDKKGMVSDHRIILVSTDSRLDPNEGGSMMNEIIKALNTRTTYPAAAVDKLVEAQGAYIAYLERESNIHTPGFLQRQQMLDYRTAIATARQAL